jgi:hypothetical protein
MCSGWDLNLQSNKPNSEYHMLMMAPCQGTILDGRKAVKQKEYCFNYKDHVVH